MNYILPFFRVYSTNALFYPLVLITIKSHNVHCTNLNMYGTIIVSI